MVKEYEGESEAENGYWADIHYYMEQNNCDKETAIKALDKIYDDFAKRGKVDFKVNFNEYVKVKVTPYGEEILKKERASLNLEIIKRGGQGLGEYKLKKDEDGYTRFQLWDLMNRFGLYMNLGAEPPFESEMIFINANPITE
jgi:hypothetical protein